MNPQRAGKTGILPDLPSDCVRGTYIINPCREIVRLTGMHFHFLEEVRKRPFFIPSCIILSSIVSLILNAYGLRSGVTTVLPHLFYLPIILTAYYYPRRGILFALGLSACYCILSFTLVSPAAADILSALERSGVFILIAGVVSYLSGRVLHDIRMYRRLSADHKAIIDNAPAMIWYKDTKNNFIRVNPAAARAFGMPVDEIEGKSGFDLLPDMSKIYYQDDQDVIDSGTPRHGIIESMVTAGGEHLWVQTDKIPLRDEQGTVTGLLVFATDITGRKHMEDALLESEEKYHAFFLTSRDCVFITTMDGRWVDFNDAAVELFGYASREDLLTINLAQVYAHPADREAHVAYIRKNGYSFEYPVDLRKKDGTIINALITTVTRTDAHGKIIGFQGSVRDVTERTLAEDALRESEARLNSILHGSPMLQFVIDKNHRVISWNRAIEEYSGIREAEVLGTTDPWKAFYDEQRPVLADLLVDERVEQIPAWYEGTISRSRLVDGAYETTGFFPKMGASGTWLYFTAAPIRNARGVIIGAVETLEDITERTRAEDHLRMLNKKLSLLSGITRHDIRNQLMALNAYIELSTDAIDNPVELREFFAREQKITAVLEEQISFTKDYEEIGTSTPVWQDVCALVRIAGNALPPGNTRIETGCSGLEIYADPLLGKVFYNLIDNSLRYGGDTLATIRVTAGEQEGAFRIILEDDGNGISAGDKKSLFTKGFGRHTGLGLFLSREILAITGITITENGVPGKGARFELTVPATGYRFRHQNRE
jgi:PAS domain S-box-containing protein